MTEYSGEERACKVFKSCLGAILWSLAYRFWRKFSEKVADAAYSSDIWMFFKILKIPADFLNTASDNWNNDQSYLKVLQVLKNIKLWNDLAERAIKLTQDYCHLSKSEDRLQDIVQVVGKKKIWSTSIM